MIRLLGLVAPFTLALMLILAPARATPTRAQMGPMPMQPLDQLSGDDFDRAFLAQMIMHHAMAVMMARPVVANASHQELKDLGQAIIDDQTREIAQMRQWAADWYGIALPDPVAMMDMMGAPPGGMPMGPGHEGHMMPGMAKPQGMPVPPGMPKPSGMPMGQMHEMSMMADLWKLPAPRLEATFMSLMIPHHQGAIDMAKLVPERAAHQELKDLAGTIIRTQAEEIDRMNGWLASWYGL
jgi:uncharacterized protein (DUF305 family)